ncbi:MAG: hypothetical protein APG12_01212 [Candidatus Methanofastidiosum methylothiophilum]|uniref:Uncharacterized protein n=1 Tax=Candidatus Methanofastidiosum methylothiophilum TaxID=1705564 RepID=A0A150IXU0_9EURY|nr:MAG: hypothetical protein APG10_01707 [Candidatus Methanofastidiosum methylthiophilus]KYC46705.1 MAG: hypothetical protein APG11_01728 [Candidatus Methanofastidiosum methylthiophilus]KYC49813.1 MAG: hypothetical protein APG12_01212 [Candidatus Methanofastidiosum methylthiophilus]
MEILWNRKIVTDEEKSVSEYLLTKSEIVKYIPELVIMNSLLSVTFTHRTYGTSFFTYEFKRDTSSNKFYVLVWRGLRSGDTSPLIFGRVVDEKIKFEKTSH